MHLTDKQWEAYGREDAYFGVLTKDQYRSSNLTIDGQQEFFMSGATYISETLETIERVLGHAAKFNRVIDFGCGVGRLVIPLSVVAQEVTGLDISDSMLSEARKNCLQRSIDNVLLKKSDDNLTELSGKYDLIHSFIVFQHIPEKRGQMIFRRLLDHLDDDGVCVAHFKYGCLKKPKKLINKVKTRFPMTSALINFIKGRGVFGPSMRMVAYDVNRLLATLQAFGISRCFVEFTNHGGELGATLYMRKTDDPLASA